MGILDTPAKQPEDQLENMSVDDRIVHAIRQVYDPEIPVNIYDMGLIYRINRDDSDENVHVDMTLTSPNCPAAQELPIMVKEAVETVDVVVKCDVEIVWDPPWGPEQMSEEAKLELGFL